MLRIKDYILTTFIFAVYVLHWVGFSDVHRPHHSACCETLEAACGRQDNGPVFSAEHLHHHAHRCALCSLASYLDLAHPLPATAPASIVLDLNALLERWISAPELIPIARGPPQSITFA